MTRTERQMLGLQRWADATFRGTLCYGVGVGKTRTALKAIKKFLEKNPDGKVVVVVPTKVLKDQWKKAGAEMDLTLNIKIINTAAKKIATIVISEELKASPDSPIIFSPFYYIII